MMGTAPTREQPLYPPGLRDLVTPAGTIVRLVQYGWCVVMSMSAFEGRLVEYGFLVALPPATFWALLHLGTLGGWASSIARRCHVLRAQPALTHNPPIERIAADLRRLSLKMKTLPPGTSAIKRTAVELAYDDCLIAACRALEVPQSLNKSHVGLDRELERLLAEDALEHAGLHFRPATH